MQFDKTNVKNLIAAVKEAAGSSLIIGDDVKLTKTGGRYDSNSVKITLEFATIQDGGVVMTPERSALMALEGFNAEWAGFDSRILDKTFENNGKLFKVVGYKSNRPKYPIVGQRVSDGKQFKFTASVGKSIMTKNKLNIGG